MKKIVLTLLFVLTCVSFVAAQSEKEWNGFYVGANGFVSSDKSDADSGNVSVNQITNLFVSGRGIVVVPATSVNFAASKRKTNGGGGGQAGYQRQSGKFVFGAESDFNPFRRIVTVSQSYQIPPTILAPSSSVVVQRRIRFEDEFSARGRIGGAFGKTLIYGTGGYSFARVRAANNDSYTNPGGLAPPNCGTTGNPCFNSGPEGPVVSASSSTQNMNGWNLGGGIERKFGKRFSIGFEYRHTDLRSKTFFATNGTVTNTGAVTVGTNGQPGNLGFVSDAPTKISLKSDSFSVRFNFHF